MLIVAMRTARLLICLVLAGLNAAGQAPQEDTWGLLERLRAQDKVKIYLRQGEILKGTVQRWTTDSLAVQGPGGSMRTISRDSVTRVTRKSRGKGALLGLAVGFGIAAPVGAFAGPYLADWGNPSATVRLRHAAAWGLFFGGVGAGVGALVGAETTLFK